MSNTFLNSIASFLIYHKDIKSTNKLLDQIYRAKVADFGTSRAITLEHTYIITLVYGTFGYLDPKHSKYLSQFMKKSDVNNFALGSDQIEN